FGVVLWAVSLPADTYPRQPAVDVLHYVFRITVSDESEEIAGEATIDVRFLESGLTGFSLDLSSASAGKGMSVTGVTSSGLPMRFEHEHDRLRITLAAPAAAGQRRSFGITYRGIPSKGLRIGKNRYGERTIFSENWPDLARGWLPILGHPSDKATSEFIVN